MVQQAMHLDMLLGNGFGFSIRELRPNLADIFTSRLHCGGGCGGHGGIRYLIRRRTMRRSKNVQQGV